MSRIERDEVVQKNAAGNMIYISCSPVKGLEKFFWERVESSLSGKIQG